jgi:voltage-gated potassium channel Kch
MARQGKWATVRTRGGTRSARHSWGARLRYRIDHSLSRGPLALVAWLAGITLGVAVGGAIVLNLFQATFGGSLNGTLPEDLWQSVLRTVDTGTFANDTQWPTRIIALLVTLSGIFLAGSLIGIIATAIDQRVERLRKGRSTVVEHDHTLILGWSPRLPLIVRELILANQNLNRAAIVILSDRDKTEMEEDLHARVGDTKNTRVVCRTGDTSSIDDLALVNIADARSIVVLSGTEGDAGVVKTILAVKTLDPDFTGAHVVAELADNDNAVTVRTVTDGRVLTINSDHVVAEVTAQACHQGGLASVFQDLLDFEGDEIYLSRVPELSGHTYRQAVSAFERCSVIGRFTEDGNVDLNPDLDTTFAPDDQVIVIAEDDDKVSFTGLRETPVPDSVDPRGSQEPPIRVLLCGWSTFGAKVLKEIDEFLSPGSFIEVAVRDDLVDTADIQGIDLAHADLHVHAAVRGPEDLLRLSAGEPFDDVIVLGYRSGLTVAEADSHTLLTLLTLRKVWPAHGPHPVRIVAELLDQSNVAIATTTGVDDFIISDALASLMIAQLSERAELQAVFDDLFDPHGAVVELRRAPTLVPDEQLPYAAVVAAAINQGASAIGYRLAATGAITMNPPKSSLVQLGRDDEVLVIGPRET